MYTIFEGKEMSSIDLQNLFDGMTAQLQRERADTQMTLGKLIAALESMPETTTVANLRNLHSYRGYYVDLAFEHDGGVRPAKDLLRDCKAAMGQVFQGYKGGDFVMGALTPIWQANYGQTGERIIAVYEDGRIETEKDSY